MYWTGFDTAILLTGIFTLLLAALPWIEVESKTRLAIGGVGAGLILLSIITGNLQSFVYPSGIWIAPVIPVVAGVMLIVRRRRSTATREEVFQNSSPDRSTPDPVALPSPNPRAAEARDPETPLALLADLAYDHPELRSVIAENPSTYPELIEWLRELQDPAINAAIARRAAKP